MKLLVAVGCLLVTSTVFFWVTNGTQRGMYMDEVFHVPQAQQYCNGNFSSWDPMITTLPGLYLVSLPLVLSAALASGSSLSGICTAAILRSVNIVFTLGNFYLLFLITRKLHPNKKAVTHVLNALALSTFPLLYFFTFLYYTDPAATFFALLTYLLALSSRHKSAAAAGVAAILCRQTNVMWVVFATGLTIGKVLMQWIEKKQGDRQKAKSDCSVLRSTLCLMGRSLRQNPKDLVHLLVEVSSAVWSYALVGVGFVVFVVMNEGIVVGDRSNHQPCSNFPQLLYFLFITLVFSFLHMVSVAKISHCFNYIFKNLGKTILFFLISILFVWKFMFIHEYNLADNRHYNFYFLSKLIRRNQYSKFILIPVYYYSFVIFWSLLERKDVFWKLSYLVVTCATIVPQRMVEFRYFILPYLIFRLNIQTSSKFILFLEILFYLAINACTVYMYAYKPFLWANADSLQRFMW